jgi:hypothetical protein
MQYLLSEFSTEVLESYVNETFVNTIDLAITQNYIHDDFSSETINDSALILRLANEMSSYLSGFVKEEAMHMLSLWNTPRGAKFPNGQSVEDHMIRFYLYAFNKYINNITTNPIFLLKCVEDIILKERLMNRRLQDSTIGHDSRPVQYWPTIARLFQKCRDIFSSSHRRYEKLQDLQEQLRIRSVKIACLKILHNRTFESATPLYPSKTFAEFAEDMLARLANLPDSCNLLTTIKTFDQYAARIEEIYVDRGWNISIQPLSDHPQTPLDER